MRFAVMKSYTVVLGVCLVTSCASAQNETSDVLAYLPLFERNSLGRKILDVRYSLKHEEHRKSGTTSSNKRDAHLVFDIETEKYREEIKDYGNTNDTNVYSLAVNIWDGNKSLNWTRHVSQKPGSRHHETSGAATILSHPRRPLFLGFYYVTNKRPLSRMITEKNSRLTSIAGDLITIETVVTKYLFSKKTGALEKIVCSTPKFPNKTNNDEKIIWQTFTLSNHVECSGFLMPLRIIRILYHENGEIESTDEYSVDPQTLRMLDAVDVSIFGEALPAGCVVNDDIEKRDYIVTTVGTLPNDVEAVKKALEKLLKQAEEQKVAVEQEMKK
jgi:hypothetical protein